MVMKPEVVGKFGCFKMLNTALLDHYKKVAKSTLAQDGEWWVRVLYLVVSYEDQPTSAQVVSLCKIKSVDYLLLRKIQQKLSWFLVR